MLQMNRGKAFRMEGGHFGEGYIIIELNKHNQRFLKQYEGQEYPYNKALLVISNQRMNDYLKKLPN